jgi:DNA replication and repair protein RecF
MHNAEFAVIQGFYERQGETEEIFCGLKRRQKKQFKRNKKEYERLSDHIGLIPLVMVSPDDNNLILEGSSERRKFIDGVISQYNKTYLQYLLQYNNILKQRNVLLKQDNPEEAILDIWDENLCQLGEYIFTARTKFIEEFIPVFRNFYERISGGREEVSLSYSSDHQKHVDLFSHMKSNRKRDMMLGYTTNGIHKDELEMMLGNFPIRQVGSQGQNKTYLISLKFAQFDFLKKIHKIAPLLLLDDIFDKLDAQRVQQIVNLVASELFGQIFITDTNREHLDQILLPIDENSRIFRIKNGSIV